MPPAEQSRPAPAAANFGRMGASDSREEMEKFEAYFRRRGYTIDKYDGKVSAASPTRALDGSTSKLIAHENGIEVLGTGNDRDRGIRDALQYYADEWNGQCLIDSNAPTEFKIRVLELAKERGGITITNTDQATLDLKAAVDEGRVSSMTPQPATRSIPGQRRLPAPRPGENAA